MEGISASAFKRLKSYWNKRRRGYERLNGPSDPSQPRPRKRLWKMKRPIRILRRVGSPKKWLTRLRDAYVKLMLNIANSSLVTTGFGGTVDYGFGFGKGPLKEYDEKVIVQIHKSLVMAQAQAQAQAQGGSCPASHRNMALRMLSLLDN